MIYINELGKEPPENQLQRKQSEIMGFYESLRWTLLTGKVVGLVPIAGLMQPLGKMSGFSWRSVYFLFYAAFIVFPQVKLLLHAYNTFSEDFDMSEFSSFLLTITTSILLVVHLKFAFDWKQMLDKVENLEKYLLQMSRSSLRRINVMLALMTSSLLLQSVLHFICALIMTHMCFLLTDDSGLYIKSYAYVSYGWMYEIISFDYFTAIMFQITKFQNTFLWNFTYTLVIAISLYLVSRFEDFNMDFEDKLQEINISANTFSSQDEKTLPWNQLRQQYTRLMRLVVTIDKYINALVFLSYSNIIFVGKQIYTILSKEMKQVVLNSKCSDARLDFLSFVYYIFTVIFLLTRMLLMSSYAARIYTLSRKPLDALYTVPASAYDNSFQRFMDQVYHSNVSLSGLRCFYVTREMVLTMLATLLTYELMLLQNKR